MSDNELKSIEEIEEENAKLHLQLDQYIEETLRLHRVLRNISVIANTAKRGATIQKNINHEMRHISQPYSADEDAEDAKKFIEANKHQLGYIMQVAHEVWTSEDSVGALTVGPCQGIVDEYGDYFKLLTDYQEQANHLSHIKHVETLCIESYKQGYRALCDAINPPRPLADLVPEYADASSNE